MKQQLTEALALWNDKFADMEYQDFECIIAAARLVERLLLGVCEKCEGDGVYAYFDHATMETGESAFVACSACHSSGQVWDEGIVEAVAKVIYDGDKAHLHSGDPFVAWDLVILERHRSPWHKQARAVLSALVELLTEKVHAPKDFHDTQGRAWGGNL